MQIVLREGLAFVEVTVGHGGRRVLIPDVIIDTGSAHTVMSADYLARIGR